MGPSMLQGAGIKCQPSGVESHNAIGSGERYHSYLRRVFDKFHADTADISAEHAPTVAVKAVKDTADLMVLFRLCWCSISCLGYP